MRYCLLALNKSTVLHLNYFSCYPIFFLVMEYYQHPEHSTMVQAYPGNQEYCVLGSPTNRKFLALWSVNVSWTCPPGLTKAPWGPSFDIEKMCCWSPSCFPHRLQRWKLIFLWLQKRKIYWPANEHPALFKKAEFHPESLYDRVCSQDFRFQCISQGKSGSNPPANDYS